MKTSKKIPLPPRRVSATAGLYKYSRRDAELNIVLIKQIKSAEALRRKAYVRLARTIGISWLSCRRASVLNY